MYMVLLSICLLQNPRPETITMSLYNGWHIMWVYDYSRANTLYTTNPVVNVFTGSTQVASLTPPPQPANTWALFCFHKFVKVIKNWHFSRVINYWYIGCLNGNTNVFTPINTVSTNLDLNPYTAYMCYVWFSFELNCLKVLTIVIYQFKKVSHKIETLDEK